MKPRGDQALPAPGTRWITVLSLLAGLALLAIGLALVVAYVHASLAERSMLFWGLVLPGIGVPLMASGAGMLLLAHYARRSHAMQRIARRVLWALAIVTCGVAITAHLRLRQTEAASREFDRQAQADAERVRAARRLQPLAVVIEPRALRVQAQPTPGLDGDYRWTLQVLDDRTILYTASRALRLHGAPAAIAQSIAFSELFRGCFGPASLPSYACVAHAGSDNLLTVRGQLRLLADDDGGIAGGGTNATPAVATVEQGLRVATFNTGTAIQVQQVQLESR